MPTKETKEEQLEREHEELFHELRATIPGAEVLFALLFASKWASLAAGVLAALAATLWWALPLSRRLRRPEP